MARANQKASILDRILRVATEGIMIVNNGVDIIFMKKRRESKNIKWALCLTQVYRKEEMNN